jgi:hypothetical protein
MTDSRYGGRMRTSFAAIAVVVVASGIASAEVRPNKTAGISIDIPTTWKVEGKGDVMTSESTDQAVGLMFWVVDKGDAKEALKTLDKQVDKVAPKAKWEKPADIDINGMKGVHVDGKGTVNGKQADLMVAIVGPTPTAKTVIIFAAVEHAKLEPYTMELKDIFGSLKPMK